MHFTHHSLTHKQLETPGCILSPVATDSNPSADPAVTVLDQFYTEINPSADSMVTVLDQFYTEILQL